MFCRRSLRGERFYPVCTYFFSAVLFRLLVGRRRIGRSLSQTLAVFSLLGFVLFLCSGGSVVLAQQMEPTIPVSQRLTINLGAGVPQYLGDATSTSNDPQSHWLFQNTANSSSYSTPGFVETNDSNATWTQVGLPYEANMLRTFINQASGGGQGSLNGQENWYRLHFKIDSKYAGQKFLLKIGGSHTAVRVFINGSLLPTVSGVTANAQSTHVVGFIPVVVDLTSYLHTDGVTDNVLAIDVSRGASWFKQPSFSGAFRFGQAMAGLFRNVYLYVTNPVRIPPNVYSNQKTWGTYVGTVSIDPSETDTATAKSAIVEVQTNVLNESGVTKQVTLTTQIVDAQGRVVLTAPPITKAVPSMTPETYPSDAVPLFDQKLTVTNPTLWYPNNSIYGKPYLYRVYHIVSVDGVVVDAAESPLGIRTIRWDANFPYFNGHAMYLWGGSGRYDYPGLGSAVPEEQEWRDIAQIAAQGGNVWRPGHSTSSEELVAAADAYGIMIDQPSGDGEGAFNGTPAADDVTLKVELHRDMIIRDRSHPSILMWEEDNGGNNLSLANTLDFLGKEWDSIHQRAQASRAYLPDYAYIDECDGSGCETGNKSQYPNNPAFGAEYWDNVGTGRGLAWDYELAFAAPYLNDWRKGRAANAFGMAQWYFADSPGEISLYAEFQDKPFMQDMVRSLGYSSVDANRFPRLLYYIYQAAWTPYALKPMVRLAHHWNRAYQYTPGVPLQVNAFSNCPSVRLLINGVAKDPVTGAALTDQVPNPWNVASNTNLTQSTTVIPNQVHWMVNWAAGSVTAQCLDENGNVVSGASDTRATFGSERKIVLSAVPNVVKPDGSSFQWTANGSDAAFIAAEVQDANGNTVHTAADNVTFTVSGPATYMGGTQQYVADPSWTTYYQDAYSTARSSVINGLPYAFFHSPGDPELNFEGGLQKIALRSTFTPGAVTITASAPGLESGSITLNTVAPAAISQSQAPAIIVPPVDTATTQGYPATFTVTASGSGTLSYQWYQNGSPVGQNSASYTTPSTTLAQNGDKIKAVVTNSIGSVESDPVTLTVAAPQSVAITAQPQPQTVVVGQSATLTVTATGSPALSYAWFQDGVPVQSGPQASYTTAVFSAAGSSRVYVIVSNPLGQVQSDAATVTVNPPVPVSIVSQPASKIVAVNQPVQFTATVAGSAPYTYQWKFTPKGGAAIVLVSNSQISNAISYTIPAVTSANVGSYILTVNNAANAPVTTAAAEITLAPPGNNLALNQTATASSSENPCKDSKTNPPYTGTGCLGAENAVDGSLATRWGSATAGAPPATSVAGVDPSWLQVDLGSVQSFNTMILNWENAAAAKYEILYTSADPATNPTWKVAFTNNSGVGGTETINFPTVQARYVRMNGTLRTTQYGYSLYEFQIYNAAQCGGSNERYTLNDSNPSLVLDNITGLTWTRTVKTYTEAGAQFTGLEAQSYCSSLNMRLPTQQEALAISGSNNGTCAFPGAWNTWTSTVDPHSSNETIMVSFDGTSSSQVTNNYPGATLCVTGTATTNPPVIQTQPQSATVSLGQPASFSVVAIGSGTLSYQWYKNGAVINGANSASYTIPATAASDNGSAFQVKVSSSSGSVYSNSAVLTVTGGAAPDFTIGVSSSTLEVSAGKNATLTINLAPANGFPSNSAISLSCSGLPSGAACAFAPVAVAADGSMSSVLTVSVTKTTAQQRELSPWRFAPLLAAGVCFLGRRKMRRASLLVVFVCCLVGLGVLAGCGGGSSAAAPPSGGSQGPQPTSSTVTVTASSGAVQHTVTFLLKVS